MENALHSLQNVAHCSSACCLFVQFNCSLFLFHTHNDTLSLFLFPRIVRNPGKLYAGKLNVSHMGIYSADEEFLNISFKETTIIRRLNVHGIRVRAMVVVSIYKKGMKKKNWKTKRLFSTIRIGITKQKKTAIANMRIRVCH